MSRSRRSSRPARASRPARPKATRRSKATTSPRVHTSALPPLTASLTPHVNAARALRLIRELASHAPTEAAGADWWQATLDGRDAMAAALADQEARIAAHNARVIEAASLVSLSVVDPTSAGIQTIDPAEIMAAARSRQNKGKRGHKSANRWLAYACPICTQEKLTSKGLQFTNTIRASASDRLIICAGFAGTPHNAQICTLLEHSQPDYRLQDKYGTGTDDSGDVPENAGAGALPGRSETQSQILLRASRQRRAHAQADGQDALAETLTALSAPAKEDIPF